MSFDRHLAATRFGLGLSPNFDLPQSAGEILKRFVGPDTAAQRWPMPDTNIFIVGDDKYRTMRGDAKNAGKLKRSILKRKQAEFAKEFREMEMFGLRSGLIRMANSEDALRERMVLFWADHFSAQGREAIIRYGSESLVTDAIRPSVAGSFPEMLRAVTFHPVMLQYLDQTRSVGENSEMARKNKKRGLNENLAREIMELHTLGVGGPYTQTDVREFAQLLTGLSYRRNVGYKFNPRAVEPGDETVLGTTYSDTDTDTGHIEQALHDLAVHPATATHLARKLVVHFVSETPDPDLVAHVAKRYSDTQGNLAEVTAALLEHPAAWAPELTNVRWPLEYIGSAFRALGVTPQEFEALSAKNTEAWVATPMARMGHRWGRPNGPDGLPEADTHWITPQGVAARVGWALRVPRRVKDDLPDPREFVYQALGEAPPEQVIFAAKAAESRSEGIALILSAPAFQRR